MTSRAVVEPSDPFAAGDTMLKLWSLHAGPPPRGADDRFGQIGLRYTTLHVIDLAGDRGPTPIFRIPHRRAPVLVVGRTCTNSGVCPGP